MRAPHQISEGLVGMLLPPAVREEVLGDLRERYASPRQYAADVFVTIPFVVASRIRRTTDPQVLLMEAFVLYLSFLAAAWKLDHSGLLQEQMGYLRLAIPAFTALVVLKLEDAYADPKGSHPLRPVRQTTLAMAFAFLGQAWLIRVHPQLAIPSRVMYLGAVCGIVLDSTLRLYFPSSHNRPRGIQ